jgi:hypothetical protein
MASKYQVGLHLSEDEYRGLSGLSETAGSSLAAYCRNVLRRHLAGVDRVEAGLPGRVVAAAESAAAEAGMTREQWASAVLLAAAGQTRLIDHVLLGIEAAKAAKGE